MPKLLLLPLAFLFGLSACQRSPTNVLDDKCGARIGTASTAQEAKALAHAKAKENRTCSMRKANCDFYVSSNTHEISVRVNFMFKEPNIGCIQAGDGYVDYIYDENGKFLRTEDVGS